MSYNQYPGGQQPPNQYQGGQHPPQGQPPYGQQQYPPPHGQQPYQQQQQWGQPPPQQQQWGAPPQGQYQQPGQWGQQPPPAQQQWGAPPPGQYQQPAQGQYGAPAPAQVRPASSSRSTLGRLKAGVQALTAELTQHGAPAQNHGQPTHPHGGDPRSDAIRIHDAISKFNPSTREHLEFIKTIGAVQNDHQMSYLRSTYQGMYGRDLLDLVRGKSTGDYEELCEVLLRPQAERDAYFVHKAVDRAGTSEDLLNDVLLMRSKEDIAAMKAAYSRIYHKDMVSSVRGDLSMKTEDLFTLILDDRGYGDKEQARWAPQNVQRDAQDLHSILNSSKGGLLGGGKIDVHGAIVILSQRAPGQLRALDQAYTQKGWNLERDINNKFKDHMKDALLIMLRRDTNPALSDAEQLERSMKGIGTHEALLTNAAVRAHWVHRAEVQNAFRKSVGKDLKQRISGETSGKYRDLLLELLYPSTQIGYR